ncbi:MAG: ATP synthase subunit I [Deltaproteobacteria bacterium]
MRNLDCILTLALGTWLALLYCGGLWLTLRHLPRVKKPLVLLLSSFIGRAGGVITCFMIVGQSGRLDKLCVCVAGFFLMRAVFARLFERPTVVLNEEDMVWRK